MTTDNTSTPDKPIFLSYRKVANKRRKNSTANAPRIWFDTMRAADAGFLPGENFDVKVDAAKRTIEIVLTRGGRHKVSSKEKYGKTIPVIDLNSVSLDQALQGAGRIKAAFHDRRIVINVHPDDLAAAERVNRLMDKISRGIALDSGSVCHGIGTLDHAMHKGFADVGVKARLSFAIDIQSKALEISRRNSGLWDEKSLMIDAPMQEVEPHILPRVEILVGGLPCVGASKAGKAKNGLAKQEEHPTAGALFVSYLAIIKQVNPSIILLENVPDWKNSVTQEIIRQTLKAWGYDTHETLLRSDELGSFEPRYRFAMAAVPTGMAFSWDMIQPVRQREERLGELLDPVPLDDPMWRSHAHLLKAQANNEEKGSNFKVCLFGPDSTTFRTLRAGCYRAGTSDPRIVHPENPNLSRTPTPAEHVRIKAQDPALIDGIDDTSVAHHGLGNGVTGPYGIAVARVLGESVLAAHEAGFGPRGYPFMTIDEPQPVGPAQGSLFGDFDVVEPDPMGAEEPPDAEDPFAEEDLECEYAGPAL